MREREQDDSKMSPQAKSRSGRKRPARRKSAAKSAAKRGAAQRKASAKATAAKTVAKQVTVKPDPQVTQQDLPAATGGEDSNITATSADVEHIEAVDPMLPPAPDPFVTPEIQGQDQAGVMAGGGDGVAVDPDAPPYGFRREKMSAVVEPDGGHGATVYQFEPAQPEQAQPDQAHPEQMPSEPVQSEPAPQIPVEDPQASEQGPATDTFPPSHVAPSLAANDAGDPPVADAPADPRPLAPGIRLTGHAEPHNKPAANPPPPIAPTQFGGEMKATGEPISVEPAAPQPSAIPPSAAPGNVRFEPQGLRLPSASADDPKWSRPARLAVSNMLQSSKQNSDIDTQSGPRFPEEQTAGRTPLVLLGVTGIVIAGFVGAMYWPFGDDQMAPPVVFAPAPVAPVVASQTPELAAQPPADVSQAQPVPPATPLEALPKHQELATHIGQQPAAPLAQPLSPPRPVLAKPLAPPAAANRSPATPIVSAPAAQAELRAADVAGVAGEPLPLAIAIGPVQLRPVLAVRVTGLPDEVILSAGRPSEGGNWLLSPGELRDLTISAPGSLFGTFKLGLALLRTDGARHPEVDQSINVVIAEAPVPRTVTVAAASEARQGPAARVEVPAPTPLRPAATIKVPVPEPRQVAALPPPQRALRAAVPPPNAVAAVPQVKITAPPKPAAAAQKNISALLARGDALIEEGDITSARLIYEHGANAGDVAAAMRLAKACDPLIIAEMEVYGVQPDSKCALKWYGFASENGNREAADRLQQLKSWLAGVDRFSSLRK